MNFFTVFLIYATTMLFPSTVEALRLGAKVRLLDDQEDPSVAAEEDDLNIVLKSFFVVLALACVVMAVCCCLSRKAKSEVNV